MPIFKSKEKPSTLEMVRKAYEDLSDEDRKAFHQSISDRVHESIGEQEAEAGDKDSQTAADREHEALGEEHAAERREENSAETESSRDDGGEPERNGFDEAIAPLKKELEDLKQQIAEMNREVRPASDDADKRLRQLENRYSN